MSAASAKNPIQFPDAKGVMKGAAAAQVPKGLLTAMRPRVEDSIELIRLCTAKLSNMHSYNMMHNV